MDVFIPGEIFSDRLLDRDDCQFPGVLNLLVCN